MLLRKNIVFSADPEEIWPLVADPFRMAEWNPRIKVIIPVSLGEPAAGSQYRIRYRLLAESNYSAEIMEFEKLQRSVLHLHGGNLPQKGYIQEIYELSRTDRGCILSQTILIDQAGVLFPRSLFLRIGHFIGPCSAGKNLQKLRRLAEDTKKSDANSP